MTGEVNPSGFPLRVAIAYGAFFAAVGVVLPFFPVWLDSKGLSSEQIGLVLAVPLFARVLASQPLSAFADRLGERSTALRGYYWLSSIAFIGFWFTDTLTTILIVSVAHAFLSAPILPMIDSIAMSGVRRFEMDYGKVRLWGSIAFIIANLAGGLLLSGFDADAILIALIVLFLLGALSSQAVPRIGLARKRAASDSPDQSLFRRRRLMLVFVAAAMIQASHALVYGFGTLYWQTLGFSGLTIGLLWALGVLAEVGLMQITTRLVERFGSMNLLLIGGAGALVRWTLFPFATGLEFVVILQLLHGLSFGAIHMAMQHYTLENVSENQMASAQGLSTMLIGLGGAIMTLVSGGLYEAYGVFGFWVMAALAGVAILVTLVAARLQPQRAGVGGETRSSK
ncbi:MAG: 3-phenylpropionate MFS transporter [Pseudomonadota bacterium]